MISNRYEARKGTLNELIRQHLVSGSVIILEDSSPVQLENLVRFLGLPPIPYETISTVSESNRDWRWVLNLGKDGMLRFGLTLKDNEYRILHLIQYKHTWVNPVS